MDIEKINIVESKSQTNARGLDSGITTTVSFYYKCYFHRAEVWLLADNLFYCPLVLFIKEVMVQMRKAINELYFWKFTGIHKLIWLA